MEFKEKKGLFARLKEGLGKTRNSFTDGMKKASVTRYKSGYHASSTAASCHHV